MWLYTLVLIFGQNLLFMKPTALTDEQLILEDRLYIAGEPDTEMLKNLQAHILKHHGRDYAWHIFLRFDQRTVNDAKEVLKNYCSGLTSAFRQHADAAKHRRDKSYDGGMIKCFYLSASGYEALEYNGLWNPATSEAFCAGMQQRGTILHDPASDTWQEPFQQRIDAMLLIADDTLRNLYDELDRITALFDGKISIVHIQRGEILWDEDEKKGIEHFGYADGVSQPEFLASYVPGKVHSDAASKDILLVSDPGKADNAACQGSFMVFRKLEQNVKDFKEHEEALGALLFPILPKEQEGRGEVAGAYVVGRFENGTPVVKHETALEKNSDPNTMNNDFDYSLDSGGSKCPYHAHIRMTNHRSTPLADMQTVNPAYQPGNRITRRGIPYDEIGRNNDLTWEPENNVGLLFMCFQSSIENGFERMQLNVNTADGIIGNAIDGSFQQWPAPWGNDDVRLCGFSFNKFVTLKGGEYFFAPSIPFLLTLP